MKYQVGPFQLDTDQNLILGENKEQSIRPKTLELLLYFIRHQNDVISKQVLLDDVWQSAGAQEHVLFQSIKEIRSLFAPLTVIKTHPRVGYQWLIEAKNITSLPDTNLKTDFIYSNYWRSAALICLLLPLVYYFTQTATTPKLSSDKIVSQPSKQYIAPSRELVVLPIDNNITDVNHGWIRLGAMDMMVNQLTSKQTFSVFPSEDVMMALARSNSFDIYDVEQKSQAMKSQLGEVVTLHSKLLGTPMEYQLHFSLVGRYQIKQGIVFANNIPELLEKLTSQVMEYYQFPNDKIRISINEQTADHNFLQAMELFHRQDYQAAIHHLATVLKAKPDNLKAQRYLLKSFIAVGNYKRAQYTGEQALVMAIEQKDNQEHLRIVFELGLLASLEGDFETAHQLISQSKTLSKTHDDRLYAAYSHTQLGHILLQKNQLVEAESLYQTALEYHQSFQCPYGQISNLSALAKLHQQQSLTEQAEENINEAILIAQKNGLTFEHAHLLINKINLMSSSNERQQWFAQAEVLVSKLEHGQIKNQLLEKLTELNLPNTAQTILNNT
jgi:DNA-binding winged helix-turn-helix (wHTH) protein/tetratricopeptide (TPR) repeat protein